MAEEGSKNNRKLSSSPAFIKPFVKTTSGWRSGQNTKRLSYQQPLVDVRLCERLYEE